MTDSEHYITTREACEYLHLHRVTLQRWVKEGRVRAYRLGGRDLRFRKADLEALLAPVN